MAGGPNFFTAEDMRWKHVRKAVLPVFGSEQTFYPKIKVCLHSWIDSKLEPCIRSGQPVNISEEMQKITIDIMAREGFDYEWDPNGQEAQTILRGLQYTYLEYFLSAVPTNPVRMLLGRLHPKRREARRWTKAMRTVVRGMLQAHRHRKASGGNLSYNPKSMICLIDENTNYISDEERISDLLLLLAGGYDTSSYSISWILLELARNPTEQSKLRRALKQEASTNGSGSHQNDIYSSCTQLRNVVRESMRVNATAALGSMRVMHKDVEVTTTTTTNTTTLVIPKGAVCLTPFSVIQRDADVFQSADEFRPSRWEQTSNAEPQKCFQQKSAALMPFALGRRNCIGRTLANAELHVIVAELVQRYEWTVESEGTVEYFVTLKNANCLLVAKPIE